MTQMSSQPWWRTDQYVLDMPVPPSFEASAGPKGVALVKAWPSGKTDPGWGLRPTPGSNEGFMPRYLRGDFNARRVLYGYERAKWAFAFIMRSMLLVCLDIDGKNGGLEHAKRLGMLPATLAETSKSGDGYHLFYLTEDSWSPEVKNTNGVPTAGGFGVLGDRIGIEQGVDFRGTGCVYHHSSQRWNQRQPVLLPEHLRDLIMAKAQKSEANSARIQAVLAEGDPMETLMMQDELVTKLARPIQEGMRNQTLYAIGSEMCAAQVQNWQDKIRVRAEDLGLEDDEIEKLVGNIERYANA
jgi:hypothetical protein